MPSFGWTWKQVRTDATLDIYKRVLAKYPNAGICLQAYLYRTQKDVEGLLPMRPSIRRVKGAYAGTAGDRLSQ
jgi:proline dehydrogenase